MVYGPSVGQSNLRCFARSSASFTIKLGLQLDNCEVSAFDFPLCCFLTFFISDELNHFSITAF